MGHSLLTLVLDQQKGGRHLSIQVTFPLIPCLGNYFSRENPLKIGKINKSIECRVFSLIHKHKLEHLVLSTEKLCSSWFCFSRFNCAIIYIQ